MNSHTTLEGHTLTYPDPPAEVAAFIERARAAVRNPSVSSDAMLALVYGTDNPLLDRTILPGRGMVTRAVLDNPLFHLLNDLVGRKEVEQGELDVEAALAAYTVDVPTAAGQLGITPQAVRNAIDTRRLAAAWKGGQWWVRPESVASFRVSKAGRPKLRPASSH